jgi:regulatory protein
MPRKPAASPAPSAYGRALARLFRRDHAEEEIRRALRRAGHAEPELQEAVLRLKRRGALDDERYAESFARSRLAHRGLGRNRVRAALRQRGVDRATAERGLAAALREVSEAEVMEALARRYWRQRSNDLPARRVLKLRAFLLRRGFPPELVRDRLQALWPRHRQALAALEATEDES